MVEKVKPWQILIDYFFSLILIQQGTKHGQVVFITDNYIRPLNLR
jgi:hypothetical protein